MIRRFWNWLRRKRHTVGPVLKYELLQSATAHVRRFRVLSPPELGPAPVLAFKDNNIPMIGSYWPLDLQWPSPRLVCTTKVATSCGGNQWDLECKYKQEPNS